MLKKINPDANSYLEDIRLEPLPEDSGPEKREKPRGLKADVLKLFRVGTGYEVYKDDEDRN
jgi:hypothetical protein